jgi:hypothetical protein
MAVSKTGAGVMPAPPWPHAFLFKWLPVARVFFREQAIQTARWTAYSLQVENATLRAKENDAPVARLDNVDYIEKKVKVDRILFKPSGESGDTLLDALVHQVIDELILRAGVKEQVDSRGLDDVGLQQRYDCTVRRFHNS